MGDLVLNDTSHDYISPIHNFGYVYLTGDDYQRGLDICLSLLGHCDILVLWQNGSLAVVVKVNLNMPRNIVFPLLR